MADNRKRDEQRRNDRTIAPGSIDPMIDTVYRVGGADPYGPGNYYSQSQLNNNMSGNDANAIYYATHDQTMRDTYNDQNEALKDVALNVLQAWGGQLPYAPDDVTGGQALNQAYRLLSRKPYTGQQLNQEAYVTGADAHSYPENPYGARYILPEGLGSYEGIPDELMEPNAKRNLYNMYLQRFLDENPNIGRH